MKAPKFWQADIGLAALALAPFGALYGLATAARMRLVSGTDLGVPVVCVGNFTLGGAGKTPVTRAIAARLMTQGLKPFVLSRGYGGREKGPHRVDASRDTAADVGDEPMLLATDVPVIVGADRVASGRCAIAEGAQVLLMDDGLQNPSLAKSVRFAVVEGAGGVGNGLPFPAGPLRAQLGLQFGAVDHVVVIGAGARGDTVAAKAAGRGIGVLRAELVPARASLALAGQRVFGFCGIGAPEKFRRTLQDIGAEVVGFRSFADHHRYDRTDAADLIRRAAADGLGLVTTRKDFVRLLAEPETTGQLAGLVNVVDVECVFADVPALDAALSAATVRVRDSA